MNTHLIRACPECSSSSIHGRLTMDPRFKCGDCGATFDEPAERAPGATGGSV